jgi:hypothetical protein
VIVAEVVFVAFAVAADSSLINSAEIELHTGTCTDLPAPAGRSKIVVI